MLRETTLTISDFIKTVSPVKSGIVRVVSFGATEITEIKQFKKKKPDLQGPHTLILRNRCPIREFMDGVYKSSAKRKCFPSCLRKRKPNKFPLLSSFPIPLSEL